MTTTSMPSVDMRRARRTHRATAAVLAAAAGSLVLLTSACASPNAPTTSAAAAAPGSTANALASGDGASEVCTHDAGATKQHDTVATYQTAYDGAQPLCRGFAGDDGTAGEGLAGAQSTDRVDQVVQWMLLHARAIYSFQPTAAWLAANPHPRDVNGFFHRQSYPAPGDTAMRAYKDFLTPAPGRSGNEKDYALVSVIVSPTARAEPSRNGGGSSGSGMAAAGGTWFGGGVWFIGCLVYHADNHEYLEPCPAWVWTQPVVPAVKRRL